MSSGELVCMTCGKTTSSFFIVVGASMVCNECKDNKPVKEPGKFQKPRVFIRYICETHNCGTYNANNMFFRHSMKDCVIKQQQTLGIIRPATFGGVNGDIGRNNFLGLNQMDRLMTNLINYKRFVMIRFRLYDKRLPHASRKYYNKHLRFLYITRNPDFHKYDEAFKKLKFNLNVYIESKPKIYNTFLTQEERSKLYYKNLMANFQMQVLAR